MARRVQGSDAHIEFGNLQVAERAAQSHERCEGSTEPDQAPYTRDTDFLSSLIETRRQPTGDSRQTRLRVHRRREYRAGA